MGEIVPVNTEIVNSFTPQVIILQIQYQSRDSTKTNNYTHNG